MKGGLVAISATSITEKKFYQIFYILNEGGRNMNNKRKRKKLIFLFLIIAAIAMMTGCGTDKDNEQLTNNQTVEQEVVEPSSEETVETDSVEQEDDQQISAETAETVNPEEPIETEEETVEMVDWETWAAQEDSDSEDIYMVVWNEELGKQEIIQPVDITLKAYITEEGDRFAIPYRENIERTFLNDEEIELWPDGKMYTEVKIEAGTITRVIILIEGEIQAKTFSFK